MNTILRNNHKCLLIPFFSVNDFFCNKSLLAFRFAFIMGIFQISLYCFQNSKCFLMPGDIIIGHVWSLYDNTERQNPKIVTKHANLSSVSLARTTTTTKSFTKKKRRKNTNIQAIFFVPFKLC